VDGHDRVTGVVFAGEQAFGFEAVYETLKRVNLAPQVGFNVLAFVAQVEIGGYVLAPAHQISLGSQHIFQALFLTHHLLRLLRIRPEIRVSSLLLNFG
jgi:hypothetical protein